MGGLKAAGWCLVALLGLVHAPTAFADTTTERSSSILIFPKVVFDGSRDTLIQISNTSNSMAHAHCFYVNAAPLCTGNGDCTLDTCTGQCLPQWQEVDFHIWLTKQQPTSWAVGLGRLAYPADTQCRSDFLHPERDIAECYGAGLDPGRIPPVSFPFQGEIKCIEVDPSGAPISGNHLKGEATIVTRDGDTSKYNAVGVIGLDANNGDNTLCLGDELRCADGVTPCTVATEDVDCDAFADTACTVLLSQSCPSGAEYNACPATLIVNHFADRADNPMFGPTSRVRTELTLVPCTENFETQVPSKLVVQFALTNEFELGFSASTTVDCWGNFFLDEINPVFGVVAMGSRLVQTRVRPATSARSAIVGVIEEYHTVNDSTARAALNLHQEGQRTSSDIIVLPEGP